MTENLDWKSAYKYCRSKNTDLVIIENQREQAAVAKVLSRKNCKFLLCGVETWVHAVQ